MSQLGQNVLKKIRTLTNASYSTKNPLRGSKDIITCSGEQVQTIFSVLVQEISFPLVF